MQVSIDPILCAISLLSFATRFAYLEHPRAVVFDELHYVKFITLYAKRIFFFDPQPPLGKQLLALVANLIGFQGDLSYARIGEQYKPEVPVFALRTLPCFAGSLLAPISYMICMQLGMRQAIAALVSTLLILENALLTQSRFILLEPILILFSLISLLCYLKFAKRLESSDEYRGFATTMWLCAAACSATLAVCIKYSGLFTYATLVGLTVHSWWDQLDRAEFTRERLWRRTFTYVFMLLCLPLAIYVGIYYAHLTWLTRAGPHDSIMTSAFQASLEGGLASITQGQPLEIVHGSQITLRHTHGRPCWLHSHEHLYPVKYADGRGSSHQQQVTCYSFKDANNWWIVKRPHVDELVVSEVSPSSVDRIKDGDLVQLVHGLTGRLLNSHDVAAAMSPYSQEVSCYVDHNISMPAQNVWQVKLHNARDTGGYWHTINSQLQLLHLNSSLALRFTGRQLPEWGFHQHEVVADKELKHEDTIWNVEEHRHTKSEDQRERELQFGRSEFVPLEPTSLTFLDKFYELHHKLLASSTQQQQDAMNDHIYACESPLDWITMARGTAYWVTEQPDSSAQVFLIGNTTHSHTGLVSLAIFCLFLTYYILRRQRKIYSDVDEAAWAKFRRQATVLLSAYFLHVGPYFLYESPLFLQYYLNAYVYLIVIIGALMEHVCTYSRHASYAIAVLVLSASSYTFYLLAPLSYGTYMSREQVEQLKWKDTWQLISGVV